MLKVLLVHNPNSVCNDYQGTHGGNVQVLSIDVLASQLLYLSAYEMRLLLYMTEVCNTSSGIQDFFFSFLQLLEFIFYFSQHTSPCIHDCSVKQHLPMNENWK